MKKTVKTLIALTIVATLVFALAACGRNSSDTSTNPSVLEPPKNDAPTENATETDVTPEEEPTEEEPSPAPVEEPKVSIEDIKTIGDAVNYRDTDMYQEAQTEDSLIYVFELGGTVYRATAPLTEEQGKELSELDILAEDYNAHHDAIVMDLEIGQMEDLTPHILPQEELDKLVGKTGQELFDAGWKTSYGFNLNSMEWSGEYDMFSYIVVFDGEWDGEGEVPDDFDEYAFFGPLTVKSVTYSGVGDAIGQIQEEEAAQ